METRAQDTYGSEGDAYRYTKKVLMGLPNVGRLQEIYAEVARNRGISSWTRAAYMDLRATFFRDGQCKIRFAPGAARIAFGELELGTGDEQLYDVSQFHDILRIISIAHCKDYTRHLADRDGRLATYRSLEAVYETKVTADWCKMKRRLRRMKYGPRRYKIIELDCFETAHKYFEYTKPHDWCHLGYESTFNGYHKTQALSKVDGKMTGVTNFVRLYLAVLPGFETMTEEDELYGESMLGIDIGPGGRLVHVNNRWNHHHDSVDERKGDNKYSEVELSMLLGGPFFELCPPYTVHDERERLRTIVDEIKLHNRMVKREAAVCSRIFEKGAKVGRSGVSIVDPRTGRTYGTVRIGYSSWTTSPMDYIPEGFDVVNLPNDVMTDCVKEELKFRFNVLALDSAGKLLWKPHYDAGFEAYKDDAIRRISLSKFDRRFIAHIQRQDNGRANPEHQPDTPEYTYHAMYLPRGFNRAVIKNRVTGQFTTLRAGMDLFIPLLLVNGKLIALHPSYNETARRCTNGVEVPECPDSGYRITSMQPAQKDTLCRADMQADHEQDLPAPCEAECMVETIETYSNPALREMLQEELKKAVPESNPETMMETLGQITCMFECQSVKKFSLNDTMVRDIAFLHSDGANDAVDLAIDTLKHEIKHTIRDRWRGQAIYYGADEGSIDLSRGTELVYSDLDTISSFYMNKDDMQVEEFKWCTLHYGCPFICPVNDGPVSGYTHAPYIALSEYPATEGEKRLTELGYSDRTVIRFDDGAILYPATAKGALETEDLRFPVARDVYAAFAAFGFREFPKAQNQFDADTFVIHANEDAHADLAQMHGQETVNAIMQEIGENSPPQSPRKPKRVGGGMKIPQKVSIGRLLPAIGIDAVCVGDETKEELDMIDICSSKDGERCRPKPSSCSVNVPGVRSLLDLETRSPHARTVRDVIDYPLTMAGVVNRRAEMLGLRFCSPFMKNDIVFRVRSNRMGDDVIAVTMQPEEHGWSLNIQGNSSVSYFTPYMVRRKKLRKVSRTL